MKVTFKTKRIFSMLLTVALMLSLLPGTTVSAAPAGRTKALDLAATEVEKEEDGTKYQTSGDIDALAAEGWAWYPNGTTVNGNTYPGKVLVLDGINLVTTAPTALTVPDGTTIDFSGTNIIKGGDNSAGKAYGILCGVLYGSQTLTINGTGTLNVTSGETSGVGTANDSYGIWVARSLTFNGGTVNAVAGNSEDGSYGVFSNNITIIGGKINATGSNVNRPTNGSVECAGAAAGTSFTLTGGTLTARSGGVETGGISKPDMSYALCYVEIADATDVIVKGGETVGATDTLEYVGNLAYGIKDGNGNPIYYAKYAVVTSKSNPDGDESVGAKSASASGCTHTSEWREVIKATETEDGTMAYTCTKCGDILEYMRGGTASTSAYAVFNQNVIDKVNKAQANETVIVNTRLWTSFPQKVMEAIAARRDINIELTYRLSGKTYQIVIPAGAAVPADVDWAGFDGYLAGLFGKTELKK